MNLHVFFCNDYQGRGQKFLISHGKDFYPDTVISVNPISNDPELTNTESALVDIASAIIQTKKHEDATVKTKPRKKDYKNLTGIHPLNSKESSFLHRCLSRASFKP